MRELTSGIRYLLFALCAAFCIAFLAPQTRLDSRAATPPIGIDVSGFQGTISWPLVKQSGIQFAMVRCGNNGGSLVVLPTGELGQVLEVSGPEKRPELRRGRGVRQVGVFVPDRPEPTLYVRFGEWFVLLLGIFCAGWTLYAARNFARRKQYYRLRIFNPGNKETP